MRLEDFDLAGQTTASLGEGCLSSVLIGKPYVADLDVRSYTRMFDDQFRPFVIRSNLADRTNGIDVKWVPSTVIRGSPL